MEQNPLKKLSTDKLWKQARVGVIIFCAFHFFYEIFIGNSKAAAFPVMVNYFVSSAYINNQIEKGKQFTNMLVMGLYVSGIVFMIRLILGTLLFVFFTS